MEFQGLTQLMGDQFCNQQESVTNCENNSSSRLPSGNIDQLPHLVKRHENRGHLRPISSSVPIKYQIIVAQF